MTSRFEPKDTAAAFSALDRLAKTPDAQVLGGSVEVNGGRSEADFLTLRLGRDVAVPAADLDKMREGRWSRLLDAPAADREIAARRDCISRRAGTSLSFCDAAGEDFDRVDMEAGLRAMDRHRTPANFDCADIYQEHGYLVRLTKGREAKAQVFEVFGRPPTEREPQWAPETVLRCEVARDVWDVVSPEARAEFNRRLKAGGQAGRALGRGRDGGAAPVRQGTAGAAVGRGAAAT